EDSMHLFDQEIQIFNVPRKVGYNYENFEERLSSSFYQDSILGGGGAFWVGEGLSCTYTIYYDVLFFSDKTLGYLFDVGSRGKIKYIQYYDTLSINGIDYFEVKVFKNFISDSYRRSKYIYYGRNVG